jgi:hypothetical protein
MTIIIAIIGFAALFALAAALRSHAGCTHDCGACGAACGRAGREHE